MAQLELLAKKNEDGSFSVSYEAGRLVQDNLVDFYDERTGAGYQRNETLRTKRGREIADYIRQCKKEDIPPRLFELTANARVDENAWEYDPLDNNGHLGFLRVGTPDNGMDGRPAKWLSIIDGGTRALGIENALGQGIVDPNDTFDVRLFLGLSLAEEIAQFLLINENQKKVRTDLSLRVVQRLLDDGELTDSQHKVLKTVVPDTETWKYDASRVAASLNSDEDSPWQSRIQMPGETSRPVTLQAFFTSLKPILTDPDIANRLAQEEKTGKLQDREGGVMTPMVFITQVLKNFWKAVSEVNPGSSEEPETTVLWGAIGVNSCHIALAPILRSILESADPTLTAERFRRMLMDSQVSDYAYWFTKAGTRSGGEGYPGHKGDATTMTGVANYNRVAKVLEKDWRASLHSHPTDRSPIV